MCKLRRAYDELNRAHHELQQTQQQLVYSEKMASLGRLVGGGLTEEQAELICTNCCRPSSTVTYGSTRCVWRGR